MPIADTLKRIAESRPFNLFIVSLIVITSVLIGLDTYPSINQRWDHAIRTADAIILWCFAVEILIRIGAEGRRPWRYFLDGWNLFDFTIVAICFLPFHSQSLAIVRLVRVLRVLRLFKAIPRLRMIVQGMVNSLSSISYISILLFVHFYIFAVLGISFFGHTAPDRFGNLQTAMLTLFQVITLENWPDVMQPIRSAFPVGGPLYFVVFILLGTMVIMNLFIGVIVNGMSQSMAEIQRDSAAEANRETDLRTRLDRVHADLVTLTEHVDELRKGAPPSPR